MSDLRVLSAASPSVVTGGNNQRMGAWGTPEGALVVGSQYDALVAGGRVFTANAGTATTPITFAGAYDADGPDMVIDVPSGTTIKPLFFSVHFETPGTTLLLEVFASMAGTLGAVSSGTSITPVSLRVGGGGASSSCTVRAAVAAGGCTVQSGSLIEFGRDGHELDEGVTTGVDWPQRTFKWASGVDGPAPLLIGDGSVFVHASSQAGTGFITFTWAEFTGNEY